MRLLAALAAVAWLGGAAQQPPLVPEASITKQVVSVGSGMNWVRPTRALVLFAGGNGRLTLGPAANG
jgi:hypothetical protein